MTIASEIDDVSYAAVSAYLEAAERIADEPEAKTASSGPKGWSMRDSMEIHPERFTMEQLRALLMPVTVSTEPVFVQKRALEAAEGPAFKKNRTDQFQLHASTQVVPPTPNDPTQQVEAVTPSVNAASGSYLDRAADEARNWASWLWNVINPWNNSESTDNHEPSLGVQRRNGDGSANPFATPCRSLTPAERKRILAATTEMNALLERIRELLGDDQFELVMHLVLQEAVRAKQEAGDITQTELVQGYEKRKKLNVQRLKEAEALIEKAKRSQVWGRFEEVATTAGLCLSAMGTLGSSGWGAVALCYTLGTAYNRWKECPVEQNAAKGGAWLGSLLFGWNQKKTEKGLLPTLKIGSGVFNLLITIAFAQTHWIGTVMEGAMQLVNVTVKVQTDRAQGRLYELDKKLEDAQDSISSKIKALGTNVQRQLQLQKNIGEINSKQADHAQTMIRGG